MITSFDHVLTSHEVATLMQVSPSAVVKWVNEGRLKAFRTPGGHRRIQAAELMRFCRSFDLPVPEALAGARVGLLVIDDQPQFLEPLKLVLGALAPEVDVELCGSPIEGLLKVGLRRPAVVLLDAYMPGMDGPEVCRRIKAAPETAATHVLATSGHPSPQLQEAFAQAGAAAFLSKPLSAEVLVPTLHRLNVFQGLRR